MSLTRELLKKDEKKNESKIKIFLLNPIKKI